jgi:hypothetical protein
MCACVSGGEGGQSMCFIRTPFGHKLTTGFCWYISTGVYRRWQKIDWGLTCPTFSQHWRKPPSPPPRSTPHSPTFPLLALVSSLNLSRTTVTNLCWVWYRCRHLSEQKASLSPLLSYFTDILRVYNNEPSKIKGKGKLSLWFLTEHHAMKAYRGLEV